MSSKPQLNQNNTKNWIPLLSVANVPTTKKARTMCITKNVSNAYVGKEYLERYRVQSAGDVLKGLNGVYNMNTRTAGGAITPNIRGITGKGRIPVTLDGTEQTVDVWLNNYGVGDRNYLDPALFRSIAVEKSPAMTRGVKSGVGGAMSIRTIEPADIIPEGKNWGIEVKTEFSGNTVAQKNDLRQFLGRDYRTLSPIGATADGVSGMPDVLTGYTGKPSPTALLLDEGIAGTKYAGGKSHTNFKDDRQLMLSAAFKTDITDGLAAYSHRQKGNYYAGKRGYQSYLNNPIYGADACYDQYPDKSWREKDILCKSSASLVPNMAVLFRPGEEIMNSHTDTKTLLLKNNWYLPGNQKNQPAIYGQQNRLRRNQPPDNGMDTRFRRTIPRRTRAAGTGDRHENRQQNLQNRLRMEAAKQQMDRPSSRYVAGENRQQPPSERRPRRRRYYARL